MSELETLFSRIFPFWEELSNAEREGLCASSRSVSFAKGDLVHEGGTCAGLTIVRRGSIRVSLLSEEGREITLYRLGEDDFCLLSASCVIEAVTFDVQFVAEEACDAVILDAGAFSRVVQEHPKAEIFALNKTVERFSDVMWVMQQILFLSLDRRLATFLIDERVKTHSDELSLTHEDIARNIGSAREAVSRLLKYFERENLVSLSRGKVTLLDVSALRNMTI